MEKVRPLPGGGARHLATSAALSREHVFYGEMGYTPGANPGKQPSRYKNSVLRGHFHWGSGKYSMLGVEHRTPTHRASLSPLRVSTHLGRVGFTFL